MQTEAFNQFVNPLYPFASFPEDWLNGGLEQHIQSADEKILLSAHVLLKKNNGLLVISNRRIILYQTKNNSLFNRALSFGWDELKGGVIGAIPVVGDLVGAKETITDRLGEWKKILNRKAVKRKEAEGEREQLKQLAATHYLPADQLLDSKEYTLIFQDSWSSFAQHIHGVRLVKNEMYFELAPGMNARQLDQDQYRTLLKRPVKFYHQDIPFILSSLVLPHREVLKKWGWDLLFDGANMLLTKEQIEDPALEEVLEEIKKINFFGLFPQEFTFEAAVEQPWQWKTEGESHQLPQLDLSVFEQGSWKRKKGLFLFNKSKILSLLESDELSSRLASSINKMKAEHWLSDVRDVFLWPGSSPHLAVLLVYILPAGEKTDEWFWLFVGDLPSSYLNAKYFPQPAAALDFYFKELTKYTKAVQANEDTGNILPFLDELEPEAASELGKSLPALHHYLLQRQLDLVAS